MSKYICIYSADLYDKTVIRFDDIDSVLDYASNLDLDSLEVFEVVKEVKLKKRASVVADGEQ